jgi:hypothetical protein
MNRHSATGSVDEKSVVMNVFSFSGYRLEHLFVKSYGPYTGR